MTENVAADPGAGTRLRALWARLRRRGGAERRDAFGEPWTEAFRATAAADPGAQPGAGPATERPADAAPRASDAPAPPSRFGILVGRDAEPTVRLVTELPVPDVPRLHGDDFRELDLGHDPALVSALHRVADSFERIAASLDADRRERRATVDDIDSLLRALVTELRSPAAVAPVVVGGTIDADGTPRLAGVDPEIDLRDTDTDGPSGPDRRPFERARPR